MISQEESNWKEKGLKRAGRKEKITYVIETSKRGRKNSDKVSSQKWRYEKSEMGVWEEPCILNKRKKEVGPMAQEEISQLNRNGLSGRY